MFEKTLAESILKELRKEPEIRIERERKNLKNNEQLNSVKRTLEKIRQLRSDRHKQKGPKAYSELRSQAIESIRRSFDVRRKGIFSYLVFGRSKA